MKQQNQYSNLKDRMNPNPRKFWLILFFWMSISQIVVAHDSHHGLETDNACLICVSQSQLNSTTLHSHQIQPQETYSCFQIVSKQSIIQNACIIPFSSRDPPA